MLTNLSHNSIDQNNVLWYYLYQKARDGIAYLVRIIHRNHFYLSVLIDIVLIHDEMNMFIVLIFNLELTYVCTNTYIFP